jgi:CRISPR system Cascade subunit CasC
VRDLNTGEETGSGHMGELEFGAGVYYLYLCINRHQLAANLAPEHRDLVDPSIRSLTEAAAKVAPEGKQATFGSRAYASYLLAEKGNQQPRSLSVAFLEPVEGRDVMEEAIEGLEEQAQAFDRTYGDSADDRARMDAHREKGSLDQVLDFLDG